MADNDRKQWNENKEPDRGEASPDRNAQHGGHPGGYGPAQGEPIERSDDKGEKREREH